MKRSTLIALMFIGAAFIISAVAYRDLPDPTPVHWNLRGEADNFVAKPLGPFLLPLIMIPIAALPAPTRPGRAGRRIRLAALALLLYVHAGVTLFTLGYPLSLPAFVLVGLGVLLAVIGNALGKLRRNPFMGLRTPWTLMDDEVWLRSNRFAGRVMVLAGLALLVGGVAGASPWIVPIVVVPMVVVPVAHSYLTWRRLRAGGDRSQPML